MFNVAVPMKRKLDFYDEDGYSIKPVPVHHHKIMPNLPIMNVYEGYYAIPWLHAYPNVPVEQIEALWDESGARPMHTEFKVPPRFYDAMARAEIVDRCRRLGGMGFVRRITIDEINPRAQHPGHSIDVPWNCTLILSATPGEPEPDLMFQGFCVVTDEHDDAFYGELTFIVWAPVVNQFIVASVIIRGDDSINNVLKAIEYVNSKPEGFIFTPFGRGIDVAVW